MYERYFGLTGKPFRLHPDPEFFFGSQGHSSAYSYLKYGVFQGEGFMVITGEIGAGKTTLVRTLLSKLDTAQVVSAQVVSTQLQADDLLRTTALAFGLRAQGLDKSQLLATLEAYFTQLAVQGRRALLVVDEAQNLSPHAMEELRMLSNFQIDEQALLQSFLVGQPELRDLLRLPALRQLRQRIIASYHLGPMSEAETRGYIEHRLKHVGYVADPRIEEAAFLAFHETTGGIPRRINMLANRVLLATYLADQHDIHAVDVYQAAREMGDEIGPDILPSAQMPTSLAQAQVQQEVMARADGLPLIHARLDQLERGIAEILEHLRTKDAQHEPPPREALVGATLRQVPK